VKESRESLPVHDEANISQVEAGNRAGPELWYGYRGDAANEETHPSSPLPGGDGGG